MTSLAHNADLKGNNFRRTIHPQSFIAVAFIFSELDRGASRAPSPRPEDRKKPGLDRVNVVAVVYLEAVVILVGDAVVEEIVAL